MTLLPYLVVPFTCEVLTSLGMFANVVSFGEKRGRKSETKGQRACPEVLLHRCEEIYLSLVQYHRTGLSCQAIRRVTHDMCMMSLVSDPTSAMSENGRHKTSARRSDISTTAMRHNFPFLSLELEEIVHVSKCGVRSNTIWAFTKRNRRYRLPTLEHASCQGLSLRGETLRTGLAAHTFGFLRHPLR